MKFFEHEWQYPYLDCAEEHRAVLILKLTMQELGKRWEISHGFIETAPYNQTIAVGFRWRTYKNELWVLDRALGTDQLYSLKDAQVPYFVEHLIMSFEETMGEADLVIFDKGGA